jgi:hypothetical protein
MKLNNLVAMPRELTQVFELANVVGIMEVQEEEAPAQGELTLPLLDFTLEIGILHLRQSDDQGGVDGIDLIITGVPAEAHLDRRR